MTDRTCTIDRCDGKHRAKGLCASHYNQAHPTKGRRKVVIPCHQCKSPCEKWESRTLTKRFCSTTCREAWAKAEQVGIYGAHARKPRPPSSKQLWRLLREAVARSDHAATLELIPQISTPDDHGCWIWPKVDVDGYGRGPYGTAAHRLSLSSSLGAPLSTQPVHHKCANRGCVNPAHLQPVTHHDNMAEMLARTYMVKRIRALETALRTHDAEHPLLREIGLPSTP